MDNVVSLNPTMGAFYVGVLVSSVFFGVSTMQGFSYYRSRSFSDPLWTRLFVLWIWCLDATHQIFVTHAVYRYLISNFFNGPHLSRIVWTVIMEVMVTGLVATFVHVFYLMRIYQMSRRNLFLVLPLACGVLAELVLSIIFSAKAVRYQFYTDLDAVKNIFIAVNAVFVIVTAVIGCAYNVLMQSQPSRFKAKRHGLSQFYFANVLENGLITTLLAFGSLVAFVAKPNTAYFAPFMFSLGRFYTISMLSVLNGSAPPPPRGGATSSDGNGVFVDGVNAWNDPRPPTQFNRVRPQGDVSIQINTVHYVDRDSEFEYAKEKHESPADSAAHDRV